VLLHVSTFACVTDATPRAVTLDFPHDLDDFRVGGKDGPLWSPALFRGTRRLDAEVVSVCALVLDYDAKHGPYDPAELVERWCGYTHVIHSTHTPGGYRVILPYAAPISADVHRSVYLWALGLDDRADASCKNPSRAFYRPTCRDLDTEPVFGYTEGALLDVDRLQIDLRVRPAGSAHPSKPPAPTSPTASAATTGAGAADVYASLDGPQQRESLALIETRCAFAAHARADAATLPEPEWYAWLSLVARCVDGDTLVHDIGSAHPGYSGYETEEKYARAKAVGPATCAHVRTLSPACKGCPLQVTSPVQLGRDTTHEVPVPEEDLQAAVTQAEGFLDVARRDEDKAIVAVEMARRRLALLRSATSTASEEDVEAAVVALSGARAGQRAAERTRRGREKELRAARDRISVEGLPAGADPAVWQRLRMQAKAPMPADTLANVLTILDTDPRWSSRFSYDDFSLDVCLDGQPIPEEHATSLTAKLGYDYALDTVTPRVMECMRVAAKKRAFHPVRDWLDGLKWDGTSRVGDLLLRGFGADPLHDEALVREVGTQFIVSLVARVRKPGEKVDTMLILTGKQGMFKSTSFETLVGAPWFLSTKLDLSSKDSYIALRGKWLVEFGEMAAVKRTDDNTSKGWMSNKVDNYRAPYAKRAEDHPRQTVACGSTNEDEFLMDPTGYRRYRPFPVGRADIAWIGEHREQLFAEASVLYAAGKTWWFDEGTEWAERMQKWAAPYQTTHPWAETVVAWLEQTAKVPMREVFTITDVLVHALGKNVGDVTKVEHTDVGNILRAVGCPRSGRTMQDGVYTSRYRRPAGMGVGGKVVEMRVRA
jgi:predicted P-loop ATPase